MFQSEFSEEDRQKIKVMAMYGMSLEDMAGLLGVKIDVLERERKFGDMTDLIRSGKGQASFHVKQKAYEMAKSGEHPQMTMFWLKNEGNLDEPPVEKTKPKDGKLLIVKGRK